MKYKKNKFFLQVSGQEETLIESKQLINSGMWGNNEIEVNTKLTDNGFV